MNLSQITRPCVIGAGKLGTAVAQAFINAEIEVNIYNRNYSRLMIFEGEDCAHTYTNLSKALKDGADWAFICVEGNAVAQTVRSISLFAPDINVVSCAASSRYSSLDELEGILGARPLMRLIPNIAARVSQSTNILCTRHMTPEEDDMARSAITGALGQTIILDEKLLPAGMSLSSCGIAYALQYLRAAQKAGIQMGLKPEEAVFLAAGAMRGAAALIENVAGNPQQFIDAVCTPGGYTIKGLNALDDRGFNSAVIHALLTASGTEK